MSVRVVGLVLAVVCGCHVAPRPLVPTARLADLDDDEFTDEVVKQRSAVACPAITRPWLWTVEKGGEVSHLFGTRHVGVGADRLPAVVTDALAGARIVAFESVNPGDNEVLDPTAGTLPDQLGSEAHARLAALLGAELAVVIDSASATELIVLLGLLYIDRDARLDDELEAEALRLGKPVVGLETAEALIGPARRWLGVRTLRALALGSRGRRAMRDHALAELSDYCAGLRRGATFSGEDTGGAYTAAELRTMEEDLVTRRNRAWIPALDELFAGGDAFVAVGVGHLVGTDSVVDLLRARGYRVTRVD